MTLSSVRNHCAVWAALLASAGCGARLQPQKLQVAAAADLSFAMQEIARDFKMAQPAVDLQVAYGSSGNFYAQIRSQAPFDVFLSADLEYPRKLVADGLAVADSLFPYGVGRIVLWVPAQSPLDVSSLRMRALEAVSVRHIAIANPQHAPYGKAAEAAMRALGVYDQVAPKLVLGDNVAQALQFIQSGAAEAGIVALSLALAPPVRSQGRYWEVPLEAYPKLEQGGVILNRAAASPAAREFRRFLLEGKARRTLKKYGFYLAGD